MSETATARVLLVEDEPQMLDICSYILTGAGYDVTSVPDAEAAMKQIRAAYFDVAVCDIMLPGASGLTLCRRIRELTDTPVCFLSAKGSAEERVAGFEAGADDYIVKPFNARELLMRVAVILRRTAEPELVNGPYALRPSSNVVKVGTRRVLVSDVDMRILRLLFERRGTPIAWRDLVAEAWLTEAPETGRDMLKTTIHRLRTKLGDVYPSLIVAVRGQGYLMPTLARFGQADDGQDDLR